MDLPLHLIGLHASQLIYRILLYRLAGLAQTLETSLDHSHASQDKHASIQRFMSELPRRSPYVSPSPAEARAGNELNPYGINLPSPDRSPNGLGAVPRTIDHVDGAGSGAPAIH